MADLQYLDGSQGWPTTRDYWWVDIARFSVSRNPDESAANLLAALLRNPKYVDHYMTADRAGSCENEPEDDIPADEKRHGPLHGPYRLNQIAVSSYKGVDADSAVAELYREEDAIDVARRNIEGQSSILATAAEIIRSNKSVYQLEHLSESSKHYYAFVLGDYLEYVVIDSLLTYLWLIVAAYD